MLQITYLETVIPLYRIMQLVQVIGGPCVLNKEHVTLHYIMHFHVPVSGFHYIGRTHVTTAFYLEWAGCNIILLYIGYVYMAHVCVSS